MRFDRREPIAPPVFWPVVTRRGVLNGDNTERLRIGVPRVDARSKPEKGWLSLPKRSDAEGLGGIRHGCEGSDGYTDYLFEFDRTTGALLKAVRPPRLGERNVREPGQEIIELGLTPIPRAVQGLRSHARIGVFFCAPAGLVWPPAWTVRGPRALSA